MSFSDDDEEETLPLSISNYYFNDQEDEAVCFSHLPLQIGGKECLNDGSKTKIFLRGTADGGLLTICKHVSAWKFDLSNVAKPEISVLSKENGWIKLQKPRKSFERVIRSVLITVHCLHLLSRNPNLSGKSLWEQLSKTFSLYEVKPSLNDLVDHMDLITEAVKCDALLAKSKYLQSFLEEKPKKSKLADENARATSEFIVDDDSVDGPELDESNCDDEDDDLYDSVCALCDNGGNLLCCDGRCMRSFHPTSDEVSARESACDSLGFTPKQVKAIPTFLCKNCEYNQHQCFACGELGSSDKSSDAEVFRCSNATCGRFYHPHCVAKLFHKGDNVAAEEHGKKISAGELFACPTHKCCVCQQGENKKVVELQFALCRRCPTAYHRKCLPRDIAFKDIEEEDIITRAWDELLVNRILIYCLKHEIDDDLGTPKRDHIKYPFDEGKKRKASDVLTSHEKVGLKKKTLVLEDTSQGKSAMKAAKQSFSVAKAGQTRKMCEKVSRTDSLKKVKATAASKKLLRPNSKSVPMDVGKSSSSVENKTSLGDRLFAFMNEETDQVKPGRQDTLKGGFNKDAVVKSTAKSISSEMPTLDADSRKRLLDLMEEAESSVTLEDIIAKQNVPRTHGYSSRNFIDRQITLGKIEGSVEAVRMALEKLDKGCSIEDAEAVCEPEVLNQIFKWQNKIRVYLAPFLYGMRYTSFGRHFTKVDKLKEIVDRLHWYVQDGDTIVDFCCGANDFSVIMQRKLEETGKKCSFRNYDIFPAKNDFNFEKRDWMSVRPNELPTGSQLIMGINPPFGVKTALANKFIDKALEFNPKLLILIVPPETERLDKKKSPKYPYELIWEDNDLLSGKSFYLPGSVDTNDKQMDQWNVMAPPLYLWSRSDFSAKHKILAGKHGHLSSNPKSLNQEIDIDETHISELPLEDGGHLNDASELKANLQNDEVEECKQEKSMGVTPKECFTRQQNDLMNQPKKSPSKKKRKCGGAYHGKGTDKKSGGMAPRSETLRGIPHSSPSIVVASRSSIEVSSSKSPNQHLNPSMHSSPIPLATSYADTRTSAVDDMERRYNTNNYPSSVEGASKSPNQRLKSNKHSSQNTMGTSCGDTRTRVSDIGRRYSMNSDRSSVEGAYKSPNQLMNSSMHSSQTPLETTYEDPRISIADDVARKYSMNNGHSLVEHASRSPNQYWNPHRRSSQTPLGTSFGAVDDMGRRYYMNRDPYIVGTHGHGYGPYMNEMDRESNLRSQVRAYGQGPQTPSYGQHYGATANASYWTNTSATQRYAPRLDELNYTMMRTPGPQPPMGDRNAFYGPRSPPFMTDPRAPRPPYPIGFAPGPYHPYPHNNSAGWLNE